MLKLSRLAALLLVGAIVSAPALAAGKAIATVNGQAIPQSTYDAIIAAQKAKGAPDSPDLQNAVKDELITREVLAQEAKKTGHDKNAAVVQQIEAARQQILINAYVNDYVKAHPASEAQLKSDYEAIKNKLGDTEYKARHVLVDKEDEAKAIIARLDKGEKFSDMVKLSKDQGSKDKGGDLDWSAPSTYVKPFAEALTKLKKGEYTKTPVKSDFGYHVILLDDTRPLAAPPYDQVKPQLQQRANQQTVDNLVKELRAKAKIN